MKFRKKFVYLLKTFNIMEIDYVDINENGFVIGWSKKGFVFGQLTFLKEKQKLDVECMSEGFCKEVLAAFVDKYYPEEFKKKE